MANEITKTPIQYLNKAGLETFLDRLKEYIANRISEINGTNLYLDASGTNTTITSQIFATASKQTELENQIKALAAGLTLNLTASPSTIYKNESTPITLTATVKDTAGNVNATSIVIKDGSTELKPPASNTYTTNASKSITTNNNTYTFTTTAVVNGMTLNKSVSISARNAVYYGMGNSAEDVKANGSKASARTSAISSTTYDAKAISDGVRFYLLVPSDVTPRPTSFSMGGAPVDMVIPSSTTTIDGIAYYVFYTNATYNSGGDVQIKAQ